MESGKILVQHDYVAVPMAQQGCLFYINKSLTKERTCAN